MARFFTLLAILFALVAAAYAEPRSLLQNGNSANTQQEQQEQQQINQLMTQAQQDHSDAVAIKNSNQGWLSGAPLAAEQADVAQSQADVTKAQQLQAQMQSQMGTGNPVQASEEHPWNCGPYPCTHRRSLQSVL